ncbi:MAG: ferrochelatase, partial [Rhodothermales bacterium]
DYAQERAKLDRLRQQAEEAGIAHFEVTSGLNCHPLFIEALGEVVVSQLNLPERVGTVSVSGNGSPRNEPYPLQPINSLPCYSSTERSTRCHQCEHIIEARRWDLPLAEPNAEPDRSRAQT